MVVIWPSGPVSGVVALQLASGEVHSFRAKAVLFATGGFGKMFKVTSNAHTLTGDGVAIVYRRGMRASASDTPDSAVSRVADVVIYRDFIYLVLALSTVGRAWWFVALVATGTPIFVLAALWANRGRPSA